ncbi:hypothetical protein NDA13_005301 [Ustilago tritici]|nr:hypothetical protein NDA13_005301 [Ustilago tritici]
MHLVGESSRSKLQSNGKHNAAALGAPGSNDLRKRAPSPSPAPAPAPAPTTPPTRRGPHEPEHRLVPADEFNKRLSENQERAQKREEILGPFWARDMDQVLQIKRDVLRRRSKRQLVDQPEQSPIQRRQTAGEERCYVGNEDLSCYPDAGTTIAQNTWSKFIWNANYPLFAQRGYVDVYLFQQDTDRLVTSWTSQDNGQGRLSFEPTDSWWANRPAANNIQPDQNISWPFYFVVLASGQPLSGTTSRLATFTAVQTTLPLSIAQARASSSSAAAAASASSASAASASAASASAGASIATATITDGAAAASALQSSLSAALESSLHASGLSGTETLAGTTTATLPNGSAITATATAQANGGRLGGSANSRNSNGLALPTYAIVLITVLGFLAIAAAIAGAYFSMAALRRRRQRQAGNGSHRSSSPMMAAVAGSLAGHGIHDGGYGAGETSHMLEAEDGGGTSMYPAAGAAGVGAADGAAMMASNSKSSRFSEEQPFTSDEASRMADAFRNALRNPEFAPGMGGESSGADGESPGEGETSRASALLREELAAEGKDLRDVGDRKKPTWHEE